MHMDKFSFWLEFQLSFEDEDEHEYEDEGISEYRNSKPETRNPQPVISDE
jgi:hypothetical protein